MQFLSVTSNYVITLISIFYVFILTNVLQMKLWFKEILTLICRWKQIVRCLFKNISGAGKVAQWLAGWTALAEAPSWLPSTLCGASHTQKPITLAPGLYTVQDSTGTCTHTYTHSRCSAVCITDVDVPMPYTKILEGDSVLRS